jgi:hypothetical protein
MVLAHDLISDQKKYDYMLFITAYPREAMMLLEIKDNIGMMDLFVTATLEGKMANIPRLIPLNEIGVQKKDPKESDG